MTEMLFLVQLFILSFLNLLNVIECDILVPKVKIPFIFSIRVIIFLMITCKPLKRTSLSSKVFNQWQIEAISLLFFYNIQFYSIFPCEKQHYP